MSDQEWCVELTLTNGDTHSIYWHDESYVNAVKLADWSGGKAIDYADDTETHYVIPLRSVVYAKYAQVQI